jgi:hypothetical protein
MRSAVAGARRERSTMSLSRRSFLARAVAVTLVQRPLVQAVEAALSDPRPFEIRVLATNETAVLDSCRVAEGCEVTAGFRCFEPIGLAEVVGEVWVTLDGEQHLVTRKAYPCPISMVPGDAFSFEVPAPWILDPQSVYLGTRAAFEHAKRSRLPA